VPGKLNDRLTSRAATCFRIHNDLACMRKLIRSATVLKPRGWLPIVAVLFGGWCAVIAFQRSQEEAFHKTAGMLASKRILDVGSLEIYDCGLNGCGDPSKTLYRLLGGRESCFIARRALPDIGKDAFGTAVLLLGDDGKPALTLLDRVTAAAIPVQTLQGCPKRGHNSIAAS
jgi:hypothetical protein